jgi:hypothetical protein
LNIWLLPVVVVEVAMWLLLVEVPVATVHPLLESLQAAGHLLKAH